MYFLFILLMICSRAGRYPRRRYRYGNGFPVVLQMVLLYLVLWLALKR